jgi:hypothetical protein
MSDRRYRALLIGNWHYPDDPANLPDLKGPLNDVSRLAAALSDPQTGLFASNDIYTAAERPSHEISYAVESFFSEAGRDEVLLFYYSGHGLTDSRGSLLLCGRNSRSDRRSTTVPAEDVSRAMSACPAAAVIIVLDCCHSGAFKNGNFADEFSGRGRFVIASSRPRDRAQDAEFPSGLSRFTGHLLDGLRGGAARPGSTVLTVSDLYRYVHAQLAEHGLVPVQNFTGEGDIAVARVLTEPAPGAVEPGAVDTPVSSTLSVSESLIELVDVEDGEILPVERIYVTARTRGGYPAPWLARTDADWVGLGIYPDRLEITLTPPAATSRANIEIRNQDTGAARTVRVLVTSRADGSRTPRPAPARPGPGERPTDGAEAPSQPAVPAPGPETPDAGEDDATPRPQWELRDKQRLCDAFLALPGMRDNDLRSLYVRELEAGRGKPLALSRYAEYRHDVWSIVDSCRREPGLLRALAEIVAVFHGDSEAIRELRRLVEEFDGDAGPGPAAEPVIEDHRANGGGGPTVPLTLADEFFLISHHADGQPLLGPEILGFGLGGAVLADLFRGGYLSLVDGRVHPGPGTLDPESVEGFLHAELGRYPEPFPPAEWIKSMHRDLLVRVIQRLAAQGLLLRLPARFFRPRWRARYQFTDVVRTSRPSARLAGDLIAATRRPDERTALLAALATVTGLYRALAIELDRGETQARAAAMMATLGPELTYIMAGVDLAIAHRAASATR